MIQRNVPHEEWLALLQRSRALAERASAAKRAGQYQAEAEIWHELGPLNQRIRQLSLMPSTQNPAKSHRERSTPV